MTGMFSYQRIPRPQEGQCDDGETSDSSRGRRHTQTFRKLPMQRPRAKTIAVQNQNSCGAARRYENVGDIILFCRYKSASKVPTRLGNDLAHAFAFHLPPLEDPADFRLMGRPVGPLAGIRSINRDKLRHRMLSVHDLHFPPQLTILRYTERRCCISLTVAYSIYSSLPILELNVCRSSGTAIEKSLRETFLCH